jgi:hypothetical protein
LAQALQSVNCHEETTSLIFVSSLTVSGGGEEEQVCSLRILDLQGIHLVCLQLHSEASKMKRVDMLPLLHLGNIVSYHLPTVPQRAGGSFKSNIHIL